MRDRAGRSTLTVANTVAIPDTVALVMVCEGSTVATTVGCTESVDGSGLSQNILATETGLYATLLVVYPLSALGSYIHKRTGDLDTLAPVFIRKTDLPPPCASCSRITNALSVRHA